MEANSNAHSSFGGVNLFKTLPSTQFECGSELKLFQDLIRSKKQILHDENRKFALRVSLLQTAEFAAKQGLEHHRVSSDVLMRWIQPRPEECKEQKHLSSGSEGEAKQPSKVRVWKQPDTQRSALAAETRVGKPVWKLKVSIKSHMDAIRGLKFARGRALLVSASEDCLVKLWDFNKKTSELGPCATLRGHTSPVMALDCCDQFIFSGGLDGTIRKWVFSAGNTPLRSTAWAAHSDVVWGLSCHPSSSALLSVSADGTVKLWARDSVSVFRTKEAPVSSAWLGSDPGYFAVGHSSQISLYNSANSAVSTLPFASAAGEAQANAVISLQGSPTLYSAHEDRKIRTFDIRQGACVREIVGHTDAVSSLASFDWYLVSGGQDESLRTWDVRTFQCLHETPVHRKKYDEAVSAVAVCPERKTMASGGADSIIKVFEWV